MHEGLSISRRTFVSVLAGLALITVTGCSRQSAAASGSSARTASQGAIEVRYGYTATNSNKPNDLTGIAIERGYLKEELAKENATFKAVPFVKAGPAINSALASGSLDIGGLGDVPAISAKANGADTVLTSVVFNINRTDVVVPKGSAIKSITDLKGKRVAVQTGSYMQRIILQILKANGMSASDVQFVNMSEVDAASAIASRAIDAAPITSFKAAKLKLDGNGESIYSTVGKDDQAALAAQIVRGGFAKDHPELVQAFYRGIIRAEKDVKDDIAPLRQAIIAAGLDPKVVDYALPDKSYYITSYKTTDENLKLFQEAADFLADNKIVKAKVDVSKWFDGSFYEKAEKDLA